MRKGPINHRLQFHGGALCRKTKETPVARHVSKK